MFIVALFTTAKTWKQPKCLSRDKWTKRCDKYIQWNITQPLKKKKNKNEIMPFVATWMDPEIVILGRERQVS